MKIVANDGREFKTVEEALEYEKKQEKSMQEIQQLLQNLNAKLADLRKDGWKICYEVIDDDLSITAKKDKYASRKPSSFDKILESLCMEALNE